MATPPKGTTDPRVKRTRQLLQQAFLELMEEKGFSAISIQDITGRAMVNRGTFYAHFSDKYALLDTLMREQFQRVLASKLPPTSRWETRTLRTLIQTVLEYFREFHSHCQPVDEINPLFERSVQEELVGLLLTWLKQVPATRRRWRVPVETIALVVSWAIFGAAVKWSREEQTMSAEQMANDVLIVIMEGVTHLSPNGLPT
jgi:AcrR family transcriptional regulator